MDFNAKRKGTDAMSDTPNAEPIHPEKGKPMDKRPHAPDCFCYKCEAEQFSAARAAKDEACSRLADYFESPPPYRKHITKERIWLVLDAHGDSVLWSDQELAVDAAVAALNAMHNPKCTCGEDSTGWVEIKCCNTCGLPHKDETLAWGFSPANDEP
jgi:hypothetical protein